ILYAYENGSHDQDIPVWIAPSSNDKIEKGTIDIVGIIARRLYDRDYANEFGKSPYIDNPALQIDSAYGPDHFFKDSSGVSNAGGRTLDQANDIWNEFRGGGRNGQGFA